MKSKKRILLKITGEVFLNNDRTGLSPYYINHVIEQIKELDDQYQFGIVVGGGNFFRGNIQGKTLGLTPSMGHQIGMLATMMNGIILKDLIEQHDLAASHFCAVPTPEVGEQISQQAITKALDEGHTLIFSGGTGNPFFTTDTNAILRSLQIDAQEIWKGTSVDGVYTKDPRKFTDAKLIKDVSFAQALQNKLGIMDATAFALAEEYNQPIRIFNIFLKNALLEVARNKQFGSIIE